MAAVLPVFTESQIQAWDTVHLEAAATYWSNQAWQWEEVFTDVHTESLRPGGTDWRGRGGDAAVARTVKDRLVVAGIAERLHAAATVARTGAEDITWARQQALDAITTARSAGFTVADDLTVTPPPSAGLLRQAQLNAQAQTLAADIQTRAAELLDADTRVAGQITTATADLNTTGFGENPLTPPPPAPKKPTIQAVDHPFKEEPPPPPPNDADDVKRILGPLQEGLNKPHRQLDNPADIRRLYDWLVRGSVGDDTKKGFPRRVLPDGTIIGIRDSNKYGPTLQVNYPGGQEQKVHLPPSIISEMPQFPPLAHPPVQLPPPSTAHPPVALPPLIPAHPAGLPPLLQNPSPPGFSLSPPQPTVTPITTPPPADSGWSWLPEMGHEAAQAGETVGAWVLAIGVAGATLLGIGSGQSVP